MLCKNGVLQNFAKFKGKHQCQSLFLNEVAASACNVIKKGTPVQAFSCKLHETSRTPFLQIVKV